VLALTIRNENVDGGFLGPRGAVDIGLIYIKKRGRKEDNLRSLEYLQEDASTSMRKKPFSQGQKRSGNEFEKGKRGAPKKTCRTRMARGGPTVGRTLKRTVSGRE